MKTRLLSAALLMLAAFVFAEEPRGAEQAKLEVQRRGPGVQIIDDQIRDEGLEAYFAAVAIPADDSHKFFLTVVYDKKNDQTDKLKSDLLNSKELAPWVQVKDRGKGTYDVYSTEDSYMHVNFEPKANPFNKDRWKWVTTCPCIVLQVPKKGDWGKDGTVVNYKFGYTISPAELSEWIRASFQKYADEFSKTKTYRDAAIRRKVNIGHTGHKQIGGYTAPFDVQPLTLGHGQNPAPPIPPDLVPLTPAGPKPLTLDQIKAAVPSADAEFVLSQLMGKVTSADQVRLAWALKQLEDAKKPVNPTPAVHPDEPVPVQSPWMVILAGLLGSGLLIKLLDIGLKWWGAYAKTTPTPWDDIASALASKIVDGLKPVLQQRPMAMTPEAAARLAAMALKQQQGDSGTQPSPG
jgi:hypothetical protein